MEKKERLFYRAMSHVVMRPTLGVAYRVRSYGLENIPKRGKCLIVANHRTLTDPLIMAMEIDRPVNWLAADFNFNIPGVGWLFKNAGVIPLYIAGGGKNEKTFEKCMRLLQRGEAVGIYPEGVQNFIDPTGRKIKSFQTGFTRFALATGAPVIPMALIADGEKILGQTNEPPFSWFSNFDDLGMSEETVIDVKIVVYTGKVVLIAGKPVNLDEYYHQMHTKELLNHVAGKIRREVIKLYEEGEKILKG